VELSRRFPEDPYAWSMANLRAHGLPLYHLPALADIYRDTHPTVVVQKGSQIGLTQLIIHKALWAAYTNYADRGNIGLFMPTQGLAEDFADYRLERAIQESPLLSAELRSGKGRPQASGRRMKSVGAGYIFARGADSSRQLISLDLDIAFLDEFDRMSADVLELVSRRVGSSKHGQLFVASTPILPGQGVNELYMASDKRIYLLPCMKCGLEQALTWEDNIDLERMIRVCRECQSPLDVKGEGRWEPQAPGNTEIHGYKLSQLYSPMADISRLVAASKSSSLHGHQQFMNMDLAEVYAPPESGLTPDILDNNRQDYRLDEYDGQPCVMGVDVGRELHVVVRQREEHGTAEAGRLWLADTARSFEQAAQIEKRFNVKRSVIDALPETRAVAEFARGNRTVRRLAYYKQSNDHSRGSEGLVRTVTLGRTLAIDEMAERFRRGQSPLPVDARTLGGTDASGKGHYYSQLAAMQRVEEQDGYGDWKARWVDNGKVDHYAHAETYVWAAQNVDPKRRIDQVIRI